MECQPGKSELALDAFRKVLPPSRAIEGVIHFDVGRAVDDENVFVATEVFEDHEALIRQEAQDVVQETIALLGEILAAPPEATIYHISSSEPYGD